jgi:AraC-like DNA-binding protein
VDPRIFFVQTIIEQSQGSTQEALASINALGMSATRLHRLFKRDVGSSLAQYLRVSRMKRATELLADYSMPIKAIAHTLGYADVSNFYRDFKKVHRITPLQWREKQLLGGITLPLHTGAAD